jgi:tripartite-type tricarboxylate transporter receptor subunit TctC
MPHVRAGKLKALATTGLKRSKVAPDLPTMSESGFPGFDVGSWYALLVPTGTSAGVVKIMRDAAIRVMALPDVQEACARQGLDIETSSPQELAARIKRESAIWSSVIKDAGIKVD